MNPEYYDEVHQSIANNPALLAQQRKRLEHVAKYVIGDWVLDFGCGLGTLGHLIDQNPLISGWRYPLKYCGVDFSSFAINYAIQKALPTHIYVWGSLIDANNWLDEVVSITTLVFSEVLEHIEKPKSFLTDRLWHRPVRIVITLPVNMPTSQEPSHVKGVWSEDEVRDLVDGIGDITELHTFGGDDNSTWWLCVVDVK